MKLYSVVLFMKIIFINSYSKEGVYSKSFNSFSWITSKLLSESLFNKILICPTFLLNLSISERGAYLNWALRFLWGKSKRAIFTGLCLFSYRNESMNYKLKTFLDSASSSSYCDFIYDSTILTGFVKCLFLYPPKSAYGSTT